jgi:valyl-tRNA synthetase
MTLGKKYKFQEVETKLQQSWEAEGLYRFDPKAEGEVFSIDTPPPTVSGSLHIGHLFSYTQAEMIARYKRLRGYNVFYPMGFDDNGLPTERLVERENEVVGSKMERQDFVDLCLKATEHYGKEFKGFFQSLGFSFDWDLCYSTISPLAQRISQRSFIDLYKKGKIDKRLAPTLWCTKCETSFAQAEVESKDQPSNFTQIPFRNDAGEEIVVATTRPELLPACVSLFVHPDDKRYKDMLGKSFKTPLFGHEVTVRPDVKADPEKGTGAVMCCTFGDKTDVEWFLAHKLELRVAIGKDGHMTDLAGEFAGMYLVKARKQILKKLEEENLLLGQEQIEHPVNTHDRCGTPQEFLSTPQWYIKILDDKAAYIKAGQDVTWWPSHMGKRYEDWVSNLEWDWCISRQRFFGVPFPLWNCDDCGGTVIADDAALPLDPKTTAAPKACECGSTNLTPEKDVMDTWATSSVTPQLNQLWGEENQRAELKLPMSLRPQAHDIIRTWAFYTIVKSVIHEEQLPWKDVMVSGFVVDPNKDKLSKNKQKSKKISKKDGAETPTAIIENFGADLVRYWALGSKLGVDFSYFLDNEKKFSKENVDGGRRLVTKLWNASKFIDSRLEGWDGSEGELTMIDKWLLSRCHTMIGRVTAYLDKFEFGIARAEIEKFFWNDLCDNYLEMVKGRLYEEEITPNKQAAQFALSKVLKNVLILLGPYMPHITEELYRHFNGEDKSVHRESWPVTSDEDKEAEELGNLAVEMVSLVRGFKTENSLSMNSSLNKVIFSGSDLANSKSEAILEVVRQTCVIQTIEFSGGSKLAIEKVDYQTTESSEN